MNNRYAFLHQEIPAYNLSLFRIGFGIFMILELLHFSNVSFIDNYIGHTSMNFKYDIIHIPTAPILLVRGVYFVAFISAVVIIFGRWLKWAALTFFLSFSYLFLLEKSIYNNHIYLFCLLSFLLIWSNANQALSLSKTKTGKVYRWNLLSFQLMIAMVYFFGGIAKINADWMFLHEPAISILNKKGISGDFFVSTIVYGGLLFDLSIGFLLMIKKTRKIAFIATIFFNVSNAIIFDDINIFPYAMLFSLVLFIDPDYLKNKFESIKSDQQKNTNTYKSKSTQSTKKDKKQIDKKLKGVDLKQFSQNKLAFKIICVFFMVQIAMPFRHYFIPGNTDWTGDAQRFSWRMKVFNKKIEEFRFGVFNLDTKEIYPIKMETFLLEDQIYQMALDPSMLLQFAHYLGEFSQKKLKTKNIEVKVKLKIGMNGRQPTYLVSDTVNLLNIKKQFFQNYKWVRPLN